MKADLEQELPQEHEERLPGRISAKEIIAYIEENYHENLTLNHLALHFHFNAIYINRVLRRDTGYTFLEILNNKRMSKARELLIHSDRRICEVAEQVGLPDQRYFSSLFKKYYGLSPRQYSGQ